jgi:uncharacterized protein YdaU (DUF1376 family)
MSAAPFMQLYVGDYLADTLDLTTEQHGAYLLLLMAMWRSDGSLPNDPQKLARFARVHPPRWAKVWSEISRFFVANDGRITNARLTKEREKAVHKSNSRAASGSLGGKAKSLKTKESGVANATALLKHGQISEPEPYKKEEDTYVSSVVSLPDRSSECLAHFNAIARRVGWPEVQKFTPPRRAALSQRIADVGGVDAWMDAITRASSSPLLTGQNNRAWRADFDWLLKAANFTKLMEGNYDPRTSNANPTHVPQHGADPALEQALRLAGIGPTPRDVGYGN